MKRLRWVFRQAGPLLRLLALGMVLLMPDRLLAASSAPPAWAAFRDSFISADGRVIDAGTPALHTTSEGQSYALFLALVAGDRDSFERMLRWTENNLAGGDLSSRLPAWQWGRHDDDSWGVLDPNSASDSDVWIAYTLFEAARIWHEPRYAVMARGLAAQILSLEVADISGLGLTLLPAPTGFHPAPDVWRLNPSYYPLQILRGLAVASNDDRWQMIATSAQRTLIGSAPRGYAPDWTLYRVGHGWQPDPDTRADGSYGAIRVYLWAAMLSAADPDSVRLKVHFAPFAKVVTAAVAVPEHIDAMSGRMSGDGPSGFLHALAPFLQVSAHDDVSRRFASAFRDMADARPTEGYYNQMLFLFSRLWLDDCYRFASNGSLIINRVCP